MRPEDKQQYLDMCPRVFVRALRDPNGNEEYELSEGAAADLLRRREDAAIAARFNLDSEAGKALVRLVAREIGYAWDTNPDCPGELYSSEAKMLATAAITAIASALSEQGDGESK